MTSLADKMTAAIEGYFKAFSDGNADAVADLYADKATVEDPLGTPIHEGRDAIHAFYSKSMENGAQISLNGPIRIAGNEAAFAFTAAVKMPSGALEIDVIDTMKFDGNGKIIQMRAYWGEQNMRQVP